MWNLNIMAPNSYLREPYLFLLTCCAIIERRNQKILNHFLLSLKDVINGMKFNTGNRNDVSKGDGE